MKWVTRVHPHVDRCASLWLIARFIDPQAEFNFVAKEYKWKSDEIPLVLPGAELCPKNNKTTFEQLIAKYNISDPIITQIAAVIHDIEKAEITKSYQLAESRGIFMILRGIDPTLNNDAETVKIAQKVLDSLYTFYLKSTQGEKLN